MEVFILIHWTDYEGGDVEGLFSSKDKLIEWYKKNIDRREPYNKMLGYDKNINSCTYYIIKTKTIDPI